MTRPDGSPAILEAMTVTFSMPDEDIGPIPGEGREVGPGHFVVQGRQLAIPGEWELQVSGRLDRFTEARATVEMTVNR